MSFTQFPQRFLMAGVDVVLHAGKGLQCPVYDEAEQLHILSFGNGGVLMQAADGSGDTADEIHNTGGQPSGLAFQGGQAFVADQAHAAILALEGNEEHSTVVNEYEGKAFKGPHSIVFDTAGVMYFTDSGPLGESSLQHPTGSVFTVGTDELLRPIAHECLAHPSGLALAPGDAALYVCETLANRLVRFVQKPQGVYHMSVFHQFSGRLGPVAVACDHQRGGLLYVARFDFEHCAEEGCISVLSPEGTHIRDITVGGAEVSGLAISPDGEHLLVTDAANNSLTKVPLAS